MKRAFPDKNHIDASLKHYPDKRMHNGSEKRKIDDTFYKIDNQKNGGCDEKERN
jgi:hypothetical protein